MHKFSEEAIFYDDTEYILVLILQSIFKGYSPILMSLNGDVEIDLEVRQLHYEKSQLPGSKKSQRTLSTIQNTIFMYYHCLNDTQKFKVTELYTDHQVLGWFEIQQNC